MVPSPRFKGKRRLAANLLGLVLLGLGVAVAWFQGWIAALGTSRPNVVLIVIDTVRADHTSLHGFEFDDTPFLKELAAEGVIFNQAIASGPWTVPAMYSLFTGLYPHEHGMTKGVVTTQKVLTQAVLPDAADTMAEKLKRGGYSTFAVNTNQHLAPKFGLRQGFDRFAGETFQDLPYPNLIVEKWGRILRRSRPHFLWVHYYDPHYPYLMREPWYTQWNRSRFAKPADLMTDAAVRLLGLEEQVKDPGALPMWAKVVAVRQAIRQLGMQARDLSQPAPQVPPELMDELKKMLRAAYASEIRADDEAIRQLFREARVDDDTLVVIIADHGEEHWERGLFGHNREGRSLYQEVLRVPLLVLLPGREGAGRRIDTPVSTVDVLPTLLDALDLPPDPALPGISLLPLVRGAQVAKRPLYSEVTWNQDRFTSRCIIEWPLKYMHDFESNTGRLYDLVADPGERHDLVAERAIVAGQMKARLLDWLDKHPPHWQLGAATRLDDDEIERLRAMGYLQ